jgi:hypothetical protein
MPSSCPNPALKPRTRPVDPLAGDLAAIRVWLVYGGPRPSHSAIARLIGSQAEPEPPLAPGIAQAHLANVRGRLRAWAIRELRALGVIARG